ncbi:hypothetical protein OPV22_017277 [Ensete ventricosum]|uniref:Uncharacterized protein n=1 Tax=Ensete ventricosum TaxID=4639 RepID=A0AAV8QXM1_ENSVE|nr:hypothetical protein OPV22_017277 [Ensete ventricosum]
MAASPAHRLLAAGEKASGSRMGSSNRRERLALRRPSDGLLFTLIERGGGFLGAGGQVEDDGILCDGDVGVRNPSSSTVLFVTRCSSSFASASNLAMLFSVLLHSISSCLFISLLRLLTYIVSFWMDSKTVSDTHEASTKRKEGENGANIIIYSNIEDHDRQSSWFHRL